MNASPLHRLLAVVLCVLLQGCVPHIFHVKCDEFFSLPASADTPWLSLSNGIDLYPWYSCPTDVDPGGYCQHMQLLVLQRPAKPNWREIWRPDIVEWAPFDNPQFTSLVSAHANTNFRVIGMTKPGLHGSEIYMMAPIAGLITSDPMEKRNGSRSLDIWHNRPSCLNEPIPRLIVFDELSVWIFADAASRCDNKSGDDYYIPRDVLKFEGSDEFDPLLRKPMRLFYWRKDLESHGDFGQPRMVINDAKISANLNNTYTPFDKLSQPKDTVFRLEAGTMPRDIVPPDQPSFFCHFSATSFGFMIYDQEPDPEFRYCETYRKK